MKRVVLVLLLALNGWALESPLVGVRWPAGSCPPPVREGFVTLGHLESGPKLPRFWALDRSGQPLGTPCLTPEAALAQWALLHKPADWEQRMVQWDTQYPDSRELTLARSQLCENPEIALRTLRLAQTYPDRETRMLEVEYLLAGGQIDSALQMVFELREQYLALVWPGMTGFEPGEVLEDWKPIQPRPPELRAWVNPPNRLSVRPKSLAEATTREWRFGQQSFFLSQADREAAWTTPQAGWAFHLQSEDLVDSVLWELLPRMSGAGPAWRTWGRSAQGRPIDCVRLGFGQEKVLFFGAFHGDEPAGKGLLEYLIGFLLKHPEALEGCTVVICPVVNPDGLLAGTRANSNGVDLNRNYPTGNWTEEGKGGKYWGGPKPGSEPETKVVLDLLSNFQPSRIVSIHSPLHNVNYDGPAERLARAMAERNGYDVEPDIGYPTPGSFGTFAGREKQIPTITLELPEGTAESLWPENREALLEAVKPSAILVPSPPPGD